MPVIAITNRKMKIRISLHIDVHCFILVDGKRETLCPPSFEASAIFIIEY